MTLAANNVFQNVQTYQKFDIGFLRNRFAGIECFNKRFENFQNLRAQLGTTIGFELTPRRRTVNSLVPQFGNITQRIQTLTVGSQISTAAAVNIDQLIFNDAKQYMERFGKAGMNEIGSQIESDILSVAATNTYRCFSDGNTAINSFGQIAQMLANYVDYGDPKGMLKVILPLALVPPIVNSGLNQFVIDRNEKLASMWRLGNFGGAEFYTSNLLPTQTAGSLGQAGTTLTVVSTNDPTGGNITQITFSGAGTGTINANDILTFQDGVSGQPNLRFLTFDGHKQSSQKVQVRATANATASGGNITVNINVGNNGQQGLTSVPNENQNILYNIVAGMQVKVNNSHVCGLVIGGDAAFLAMPKMPSTIPFPEASYTDEDSGISTHSYYGYIIQQAATGFIQDQVYGWTGVDEYLMRIAFPVT